MAGGFVYLFAVVDWFSRRVLSWRLSITMEEDFCIEAVEEAMIRYGKPEILNTDQGSQFTSIDFTDVLKKAEIAISMDSKGAWRHNCGGNPLSKKPETVQTNRATSIIWALRFRVTELSIALPICISINCPYPIIGMIF
ncbi:transposase InsO family protein [Paenochrobactrum gallinarii]|uniref:Transposase InsO family protein n=1 Tax=Paenochrobactrum gallinarii TaxID=643673 RepID=A0A841M886_9HYPH|nr:transposase InsO family protein [Paenochrobactrum gallinarii]